MATEVIVIGKELNKPWKYQGKEGVNNYLHVRYPEPISGNGEGHRVEKIKFNTSISEVYRVKPGDRVGVEWNRWGNAVGCIIFADESD